MRIISRIYKNRKIKFNKLKTRPTTDYAKESLFNLLNNMYEFQNICVLDLFAGTGNISYEFCSRGVKHITAVDNNKKCVDFIKKIKLSLDIAQLNIAFSNSMQYIGRYNKDYDLIFADPPYKYNYSQYQKINRTYF